MKKINNFSLAVLFFIVLSGCATNQLTNKVLDETEILPLTENTIQPTTSFPTETEVPEITEAPIPTEIPIQVFSPLKNYPLEDLLSLLTNPYNPPGTGSDDPHQGVDFSIIDPNLNIALTGEEIQTIISGEVVVVIEDRFPYGNGILVETPIAELPAEWIQLFNNFPQPEPFGTNTSLTCPVGWNEPAQDLKQLSFYILYAHLENPPELVVGDKVSGGEIIGSIGDSGNALAPHLHIEMRYGYSSDIQGSMAHYEVRASESEMSNYCRWRVSGWFRSIDPMDVFFRSYE